MSEIEVPDFVQSAEKPIKTSQLNYGIKQHSRSDLFAEGVVCNQYFKPGISNSEVLFEYILIYEITELKWNNSKRPCKRPSY